MVTKRARPESRKKATEKRERRKEIIKIFKLQNPFVQLRARRRRAFGVSLFGSRGVYDKVVDYKKK